MANAKETSPAKNTELKIHKKFFVNDIVLSIGQKNRYTVQRRYTIDEKTGYSEWIRLTDLRDVEHALRCYEQWCDEHPFVEASDQAA